MPRSKASAKPEDYQVVVQWSDDDGCYLASLPAWQSVRTHGTTLSEATQNAYDVLSLLIADAHKRREPIPPVQRRFSGRFNLRLPVSLHERLNAEAEREGISLNQWIIAKLAS